MSVAPAPGAEEGAKPVAAAPVVVATPVVQAVTGAVVQAPADDIMAVKGIFVKQKIELLEVITSYETQNKYKVYEFNDGAKGRQMFKAKEDSECCERQMCGASRGFAINITTTTKAQYLQFQRPLALECFCACRSLTNVVDPSGQILGEVFHPFNCCSEILEIRSPQGELWYTITPGCCCSQLGMVCQCPCPACMEIKFPIYAGNTDRVVGELTRHHPGCGKALLTDADHFSLVFPEKSNFAQRASLFAAVFIFDFIMFENNNNQNNNHGAH